jgi:Uma2 family endonuclease
MALPQSKIFYTVEEYLAFERQAEERHEYIDGYIYKMAGELDEHNGICVNLTGELRSRLQGTPCRVRAQNMKVRSGPSPKFKKFPKDFFSYPDVLVVCGESVFHDEFRDVILNPKVIIEVLSDSTEAFDRGEKFIRYRIYNDTLTDYLLVSQKEPFIEHFSRQSSGIWHLSSTSGLKQDLYIASIDCRVPMSQIYYEISFKAEDSGEVEEPEQNPSPQI